MGSAFRRGLRGLAVLLGLSLAGGAMAANTPIAVAPITVTLDPASEFAAVDVSNRGDSATAVEVEAVRVKWVDGREQYEPTTDFTVTPPSFPLQAGKSRLVRFRYTGPRGDTEGMYRLFVRQLPSDSETSRGQVAMLLNIGIPVFIAPTSAQPALVLEKTALVNTGNVSITVSRLEGGSCLADAAQTQARIAPRQRLALKPGVAGCITGAQTDRGLMPLASP